MYCQLLNLSKILSGLSYLGRVVVLDEVNSTNQYLIDNISDLQSGFVCLSESQTHGRGRYGKYWYSPFGGNLYLSIYWSFLNCRKESIVVLSLVISVVLCEVLESLGIQDIQVKWPNDVYCNKRKLAGVLVEVIPRFHECIDVVIGIGINTTMKFNFLKNDLQMICLEELGIFVDRNVLAVKVINGLYQSLTNFERFGFVPFFFRWLALDNLYNQSVKLFFRNHVVLGVYRGIDFNGLLLLDRSGLICSYSHVEQVSLFF